MGYLDNAIDKASPSGSSIAKPLMKVFCCGIGIRRFLAQTSPAGSAAPELAFRSNAGGLLGGLEWIVGKASAGRSWRGGEIVGRERAKPGNLVLFARLDPRSVGHKGVAAKLGKSEEEVTTELSQLLPGLVDKLTPQGRLPTQDEVAK